MEFSKIRPYLGILTLLICMIPAAITLLTISELGADGDAYWLAWLKTAISLAPTLQQDASLYLEATPAGFAFALAFFVPKAEEKYLLALALIISAAGYLSYLYVSSQVGGAKELLLEELQGIVVIKKDAPTEIMAQQAYSALMILTSSARTFYLIVIGGIVGAKVRERVTGK